MIRTRIKIFVLKFVLQTLAARRLPEKTRFQDDYRTNVSNYFNELQTMLGVTRASIGFTDSMFVHFDSIGGRVQVTRHLAKEFGLKKPSTKLCVLYYNKIIKEFVSLVIENIQYTQNPKTAKTFLKYAKNSIDQIEKTAFNMVLYTNRTHQVKELPCRIILFENYSGIRTHADLKKQPRQITELSAKLVQAQKQLLQLNTEMTKQIQQLKDELKHSNEKYVHEHMRLRQIESVLKHTEAELKHTREELKSINNRQLEQNEFTIEESYDFEPTNNPELRDDADIDFYRDRQPDNVDDLSTIEELEDEPEEELEDKPEAEPDAELEYELDDEPEEEPEDSIVEESEDVVDEFDDLLDSDWN